MTEKVADSIKFLISTYERLLQKQKDEKLTKSELETLNSLKIDKDRAREIVYGMPHSVWKEKYQTDADEYQKNKFINSITKDH